MDKIYVSKNLGGTVYVTLSPDGDECHQFDSLGVALLYCEVEYGGSEVCE